MSGTDCFTSLFPYGWHCGTVSAGWLSSGRFDVTNYSPLAWGALPTPRDGVVPATACFSDYDGQNGFTCVDHVPIAVLNCGAFLLWRLPDAPSCPFAYCAAPSGLFGG